MKKTATNQQATGTAIEVRDMDFSYGKSVALKNINMDISRNEITAFIGPSGCGKSTLLRCFNRMNDLIPGARVTKRRHLDRRHRNPQPGGRPVELRRRVGMVFQKSNPFPRSIYENVAYGPRILGEKPETVLDEIVEKSPARLRAVGRGEGPPPRERLRPFRRPAAAALHRPHHAPWTRRSS
jgi:phosphate transport system ATP-binding protein